MKNRLLATLLTLALLAGLVPCGPARAASVEDYTPVYSNFNGNRVMNGIEYYPAFAVDGDDLLVQSVTTYHWNNGQGGTPGTISIYNYNDELIGTWNAIGRDGAGIYFDAFPNVVLKAGTSYYIVDSDQATWSSNEASRNTGFFELRGMDAPAQTARSQDARLTYRGIRIVIDGEEIIPTDALGNPAMPFIYNDSTYLPVRAVAGALGLEVGWDGETSTVLLSSGGSRTALYGAAETQHYAFTGRLTWRGISIMVDGIPITPRDARGDVVEPFIYNDSTYLPVRALANALGFEVGWDNDTSTVEIRSSGYTGEEPGGGEGEDGLVDDYFGEDYTEELGDYIYVSDDPYVDPDDDTVRMVSPEEPTAFFPNGVEIDFGEGGLTGPLLVQALDSGTYGEEDRSYHQYDFTLGDGTSELDTLVTVSLPCDGADPTEVFVEVWEDGEWVPIHSEPSADGTKVCFYPEHFSAYRVGWWDTIKGWIDPASRPVFYYLSGDPKPDSLIALDYAALNARLDQGDPGALLKSAAAKEYAELAFDAYGYATDALGAYVSMKDLIRDYSSLQGLSDRLGDFGAAATFVRIYWQWWQSGDLLGAIRSSGPALAKLASDYALKKTGTAAAATALSVSNVLYLVYEMGAYFGNVVQTTMRLGGETEEEYAYRRFTLDFVALNNKTLKAAHLYSGSLDPLSAEKAIVDTYYGACSRLVMDLGGGSLSRSHGMQKSWAEVLKTVVEGAPADREDLALKKMNEAMNQYCYAFWRLPRKTRWDYLRKQTTSDGRKPLSAVWREPSKGKMEEYAKKLKGAIYAENQDVFKTLTKKAYEKMRSRAIQEAKRQESWFNEKLTFTLRDPAADSFAESVYAGADIRIRQTAFTGEEDFRFTKENGWQVTCTRYAWLLASQRGMPGFVDVVTEDGQKLSFPFTFTDPNTEITLAEEPRQTYTTSLAGEQGTMTFTVTGGRVMGVKDDRTDSGGSMDDYNPFTGSVVDWAWESKERPLNGEVKRGEILNASISCDSEYPFTESVKVEFDGEEQQLLPEWLPEEGRMLKLPVPEGVARVTVIWRVTWSNGSGFFTEDEDPEEPKPDSILSVRLVYFIVDEYSGPGLGS